MPKKNKLVLKGGASRSERKPTYFAVPKAGMYELTSRLQLGIDGHGLNNWRKGELDFALESINHLGDHFFDFLENGEGEVEYNSHGQPSGNLGAMLCGLVFLAEIKHKKPEVWKELHEHLGWPQNNKESRK
jgi:hypothetical protein